MGSLVVVSDWRNSLSTNLSNHASLAFGFTDFDPALDLVTAAATATWFDLGSKYHSQVIDLRTKPCFGAFIIARFTCSDTDCKQTTLHYVYTSDEILLKSSKFESTEAHPNAAKNILLGEFNINCATPYKLATSCLNDFVYEDPDNIHAQIYLELISPTDTKSMSTIVIGAVLQNGAYTQDYFDVTAAKKIVILKHKTLDLLLAYDSNESYRQPFIHDPTTVLTTEDWKTGVLAGFSGTEVRSELIYLNRF